MKKFFVLAAFGILVISNLARAQQFQIVPKVDGSSGITIAVPYILGVHHGSAAQVSGSLLASNNFGTITGSLVVPLASMTTGNPTRDCHMRESLGIDYTKSQYPKTHICDSNNQLPSSGGDSVVFQNVVFKLLGVTSAGDIASQMKVGNTINLSASGTWVIHGVEKNLSFPLKVLVLDGGNLNIKGSIPFSLSDYGIVVKPVLGIGVNNNMTADLDIIMAVQK